MADYLNPLSALPSPSTFNVGGVPTPMSGLMAGQQAASAAPFLQQDYQERGINLQKLMQQLQEFQGPEQTQARRESALADIATAKKTQETAPLEVILEQEKAKLAPYLTKAGISKAQKEELQSNVEKANIPIHQVSALFPEMDKIPESARPMHYESRLKSLGIDPSTLPKPLQSYNPETMGHLAAAREGYINSIEQSQKIQQERVKGEEEQKTARIQASATLGAASIRAKTDLQVTKMNLDAGKYGDVGRLEASIRKELISGKDTEGTPLSPEMRKLKEQQLGEVRKLKIIDLVNKNPRVQSAATMATTNNPADIAAYQQARQDAYAEATHQIDNIDKPVTEQDVKAKGDVWDPNKYEYRRNPVTGQIEKRPKGKK